MKKTVFFLLVYWLAITTSASVLKVFQPSSATGLFRATVAEFPANRSFQAAVIPPPLKVAFHIQTKSSLTSNAVFTDSSPILFTYWLTSLYHLNRKDLSLTNPSFPISTSKKLDSADIFMVPERIRPDVDFWAKVYREWDTNQVVFYDSPTKIVYEVLSLPKLGFELSSARFRKDVEKKVKEITDVLKAIELSGGETFGMSSPIFAILKNNAMLSQKDLVQRLRYQNGLRTQFEYGLKMSGRYETEMKAVLRSQELPDELLAMVFVESLFYLSSVSHAGAAGPWGIMRETAISTGIHVNKFTDERLDPVVSTWAAARYLKKAKGGLMEWPLVITSYNYGYPGMMRAVSNLQSRDFSVIVDNHESPIFGYASKNYYAEFLGALDTIKNQEHYFPDLTKERQWQYEFVQIQRPVHVDDLVNWGAISREDLLRLNPSLTKRTLMNDEVIPKDYALRVPKGSSKQFYAQLKKVPQQKRQAALSKISSKYLAKGKESLIAIGKRLGISAKFLGERLNKPLEYKPSGPVIIRSQAHLFTPILEINKDILSALSASDSFIEKPAEIGRAGK